MTASFQLDQEPQAWFKHFLQLSTEYTDIQIMTVVSTTWFQSHSAQTQDLRQLSPLSHIRLMNGDPACLHPWPFVLVHHRQRHFWISYHQYYKLNWWSLSQSPSACTFSKNECVLHPFKGSTSTACNWQMKEIKMMRWYFSVLSMPTCGQVSVGDKGERFPWGWGDLLRGTKAADQKDQTSPGQVLKPAISQSCS